MHRLIYSQQRAASSTMSSILARQVRLLRNFSQQSRRNLKTKIDSASIEPEDKKWVYISFLTIPPVYFWFMWDLVIHPEHDHPPKFVKWPHMRLRERDYFFGDGKKTPFHGVNNALADGWEDENPNKKMDEDGVLLVE